MLRVTLAAMAVVFTVGVANAEPLKLTDTQMDGVTAGSFVFAGGSQPNLAGANPIGGQGDLLASFGPNAGEHPNLAAWGTHTDASGFSPNQGQAGLHTPLDFGSDL